MTLGDAKEAYTWTPGISLHTFYKSKLSHNERLLKNKDAGWESAYWELKCKESVAVSLRTEGPGAQAQSRAVSFRTG